MNLEAHPDLQYIAQWALEAPVPPGWSVHLDEEGIEYFFNTQTNESTYEHPMDQKYKKLYNAEVKKKLLSPAGLPFSMSVVSVG
jgi:hypothetical protein